MQAESLASDETLVYLVRHGQTAWNQERRFQGHTNIGLSALGIRQASDAGRWLAARGHDYAAVYTSDLSRARQTAAEIGSHITLRPQVSHELREIHCGEWQGHLSSEVETKWPGELERWQNDSDYYRIPGGESVSDVQVRVMNYYRSIVCGHRGQAVVLVSHGVALSALIAGCLNWSLSESWAGRRARMDNAATTLLTLDHATGVHRLGFLNYSTYLGSAMLDVGGQEPP